MNHRSCLPASLLALFALAFIAQAVPQNAPTPAPANGASSAQDAGFRPGLDDLMTMLIQPRHNKLYLAGSKRNWELAASEARDLRRAFGRISQYMPRYLDVDVGEATRSIIDPMLESMDVAIAAGDPKRFTKAYEGLTGACNACHAYMEHSYLVIKVPTSSVSSMYPDEEFAVTR